MKQIHKKLNINAVVLVASLMMANGINFIYNAWLGRALSFEDFGLITLVITLAQLVTIPLAALGATVNHRIAFLSASKDNLSAFAFFRFVKKTSLAIATIACFFWLLATPFIASFFQVSQIWVILLIIPFLLFGTVGMISKSYLQGRLLFNLVGMLFIIEATTKLFGSLFLYQFNLAHLIPISIPLSVAIYTIVAIFLTSRTNTQQLHKKPIVFPKSFFVASILTGLSSLSFLSFDVVLVKHFMSPVIAGQYSFLALTGKMIFFLGSLINGFIVTLVSHDIGKKLNTYKRFYQLILANFVLVVIAWIALGMFGKEIVPLLFGQKALAIISYLPSYSLAISLFTITTGFVLFHLARKQFLFSFVALCTSLVMSLGIVIFHDSLGQIVNIILLISVSNFFLTLLLHILQRNERFIMRNLIDLFDAFFPLSYVAIDKNFKRILIFNWRDTKHKYAGGAEVYIHELAKRWVGIGHTVTVFCGNDGTCLRNETIDGVRIIRRGGFYFVYLWAFVYYLKHFRGRYDVILDCQNGIPFFTPMYAREKVYCLMFHVHQKVFYRSLSKPLATLASVLENRVMPWVYKNTKFITISQSTKKAMQKLGIGTAGIQIIYPGVDLSLYKKAKKSKIPTILYVGRLKFYKSLNVFIRSAQKILALYPKARFIIAGDGEEKHGLKALVQKLDLEKKITFLGKVSEVEKIRLYQKAWIFVNPSFMEGWGITSIEANACATPVIAADVPGLRDSIKNPHSGFLVPHGDINGFVEHTLFLLKDDRLRNQISQSAYKWAKHFDWDKSAKKMLKTLV